MMREALNVGKGGRPSVSDRCLSVLRRDARREMSTLIGNQTVIHAFNNYLVFLVGIQKLFPDFQPRQYLPFSAKMPYQLSLMV